ncbi:D-ribose pyranase [Facklamia sp. DSM 111018]|uniref:D-ribose pyranase n=1 Tax=Facklamia lactis TaxID=2749967 RepID=A0ABS0LQC3_9LACT|nr:D-ribose pyranase [Facklamia lactis]MBG9980557.1 D-ribose pyranase [Facklamia lactis]MBG9986366.1 D-ribose pyranase [Facklamia lactis]
MIKKGIFHPQLLKLLGEVRHMDTIIIGDAGLPVPEGVTRIDLGWIENEPRFHKVLEEIVKVLVIEKATFANEAKDISPDFLQKSISILPEGLEIDYIPHVDLKEQSKQSKAIILSGEFTGYTNIIITCGCAY